MFSFYNIWVVARYELLLLFRSWFFRIFGVVVIGLLGFFNVIFFTNVTKGTPWMFQGVPSAVPYLNLVLLNPIQAILCVFLASDFLKRDTKVSTVEVIYMRSISNAEYIIGKTLGVILIFFLFNLLILTFGGLVNSIFSDIPFRIVHYLMYFGIISVPTILFAIGFTFIVMSIFRNPPVTWVFMIGITAVSLFYLKDSGLYIFDLVTFYLPLSWSDFTGFSDMPMIIMHRAIYASLGLSFIFVTVLFMKRLPQSPWMNRISFILFIAFGAAAIGLGVKYGMNILQSRQLRSSMLTLNEKAARNAVQVGSCDLYVKHTETGLDINAKLFFNAQNVAEDYIFSLNPGFNIKSVFLDGEQAEFDRQLHLVTVHAKGQMGSEHVVELQYAGNPLDKTAYIDLTREDMSEMNNLFIYKLGKKYSFVTPDYVLLTVENLWYPVAGAVAGPLNTRPQQNFIRFRLDVETNPDLYAISQGEMSRPNEHTFHFENDVPIPQISLVIGDYNQKSITVDSVDINLYTHKEHNYYQEFFTDIGDTLQALIRENMNNLELQFGVAYPFSRFSIVEVPLHYMVYERPLRFHYETVQPEQVFLIENGLKYMAADFAMNARRQERFSDRSNRTFSAAETQAQMFNRFVENVFMGDEGGRGFGDMMNDMSKTSNIFPNLYTYVNQIPSKDWPVLNKTLEAMMFSKMSDDGPRFFRRFAGLLGPEKANLLLQDNSFKDILSNTEHRDLWNDVFSIKSEAMNAYLKYQLGSDQFEQMFNEFLKSNQFQQVDFSAFLDQLSDDEKNRFSTYLQTWYEGNTLPAFYVTNTTAYKVLDGNRSRYQLRFDIQNDQPVDGVISVSFRLGRGGFRGFMRGGPGGDEEPERIYNIGGNKALRIGIVLDSEPRGMTINTLTSCNLPIDIDNRFDKLEVNERAVPFDGIREIGLKEIIQAGEIVVDNEDPGFKVTVVQEASMLKRMIGMQNPEDDEYKGFNPWRVPNHWQKTVQSEFWGKTIHSAHVINGSKTGVNKVTWTVDIQDPGQYDVYIYLDTSQLDMFRRRNRNVFKELNYNVYHDDGVEPVIVDIEGTEPGWVLLGDYYLSSGKATVELSDKTQGKAVIADAVKWVKR